MTTTTSTDRSGAYAGSPGGTGGDEPITATTFSSATKLVAWREMMAYLRGKGFWIESVIYVVGIFALAILPTLFDGGQPSVAVVGSNAASVVAGEDFDVQQAADLAAAEALVAEGEVDAAIVPDISGASVTGLRVIALEDVPIEVLGGLATAPPVDLLEPAEVTQGQRYLVTFAFAMIFFIFGIGGVTIAQSVVTEKQTRIVEILVAAIPTRAMLAGKISGISLLSFAQIAVIAVAAPIALRIGGHQDLLAAVAPAIGWFVPFFIAGFILLGAMWAVAGSLISRQEDLGKTMGPIMMLLMVPYVGVMMFDDNRTVMTVLSYLPFSAPVGMPVRLFAGDAALWEPFLALGILLVSVVGCVLVAARLYNGSLLQLGAKVKLAEAWAHTD